MDLDDLRSFANVVRYGGFAATERVTGETRGKLSKRVAKLEQELGIQLLERTTRSIRITEAGSAIFRQCSMIEQCLDETRSIAARTRDDISGILHVSCPPGLARHLGSDPLATFLRKHPRVRVRFETIGRRVDIIREGYDVAFRIDLEQETDLSLTMRKMGKSRRILVASPAFLEEQPVIDLETLGDIPTLTIGDHIEHERWLLVRDSGEERKISLSPRFCSNDSVQVRQAAIEGLGVAMLHEQSCLIDCEEGRLVRILPEWHSVDGIVHMVFAAREGMSAAKRAFIDHYADQVFFPDRPAGN